MHYLLTNLTVAARLIAGQKFDSGFEKRKLLHQEIACRDATRHVSLWAQLLDYPATFASDFNTCETIEQQVGTPLPDGLLVATLPNKVTGALQQHLRLNARTLQANQYTQ